MIQESPLPITIDHDWSRVRKVYEKLTTNYRDGFFNASTQWIDDYKAYGADIGIHGRFSMSEKLTDGVQWYQWSGSLLERLLPFAHQLRQTFQYNGLHFCNFSYTQHTGSIDRHIDSKRSEERTGTNDPLKNQCNANYIITSLDPNSSSYWEYQDSTHWYPSKPGQTWLIDSSVPHWVANNGFREVFQFRFHDPYLTVKQYFEKNPLHLVW
jgi:hypothetical protein